MEPSFTVPALIFLAEMTVVTLSTLRTIFIARGHRLLAPVLGFFEVTIWLLAITQVMQHLQNAWCFFAFALGFTVGNLFGILIEKALAMGMVLVRIITPQGGEHLANVLRECQFGVTSVDGQGARGPVQVMLCVLPRRQLKGLLHVVEAVQPEAFYSIDELQSATEGIYPQPRPRGVLPTVFESLKRMRLKKLVPSVRD